MEIKYIILIIGGTIILSLLVIFIVAFIFLYQKRYYKYLKEKQESAIHFSQTLLQSQVEIQEQTLQHISRELHDNISQVASLIKMNLNGLLLFNPENPKEKIEDTLDLTRQLITDIKSLSVSLSSDRISEYGLVKAIETEVKRLNKSDQFTASLLVGDNMPTIDDDKAVILYRMAQEVLNNIVKHSNAQKIDILLNFSGNLFSLIFRDNGQGFDVEEKKRSSGAGLRNLATRAQLINAQLEIQSNTDTGTTVRIEIPF